MDRVAVSRRMALQMFWNNGFDNEAALLRANEIIGQLNQASEGYYYADDVVAAIDAEMAAA
jgi:hypothetical protein